MWSCLIAMDTKYSILVEDGNICEADQFKERGAFGVQAGAL